MKKNIIITILTTSIILFTILAIVGMNMEDEVPTIVNNNESRDTFITSCMSDSANYAFCACGYDRMMSEYGGEKGMKRIHNKMTDENPVTEEILEVANYCKYLNK